LFFLQPSQKRLLSSLNPLFLALAVFVGILIRTSFLPLLPGFFTSWDVLLPFMVYFGQRRALGEGLILSLFTSHLYSLCSSAPIGVFTSHYLVLFLLARLLSFVVYANTWFSVLLVVFVLTIAARLSLTAVAWGFGHAWPLFSSANFGWWSILFNSLLGFAVFEALGTLDRFTYKVPRMSIELGEGSL
jgi:hypothetical protein